MKISGFRWLLVTRELKAPSKFRRAGFRLATSELHYPRAYFSFFTPDIRSQMEQLISDSLSKSQNVHKSIKVFQENLSVPSKSRIVTRVKNLQLSLIKNEYLTVYREHSIFVEKYEEKLKKILKREAHISELCWLACEINLDMLLFQCREAFRWKRLNNF